MFPHRLSEATADEIRSVIKNEVAESLDFELKKALPTKKGNDDPWLSNGKVGDEARNVLASEINAFANTIGGTLIIGIDEDSETKRAKAPIIPLPRCKELAETLHQSIGSRIEPKLPYFECEGIVTEADGSSGIIIMRTLESYLAPHRHTQDNHCYVRRNDRSEPMSMIEIQELTRRKARSAEEAEKEFHSSAEAFFSWIPEANQRTHPARGLQGVYDRANEEARWNGLWAMRLTARPLTPLVIENLPQQPWLQSLQTDGHLGTGQLKSVFWHDLQITRAWQPRLRAVERELRGKNTFGRDRVTSSGLLQRFIRLHDYKVGLRPDNFQLDVTQVIWNAANIVRCTHLLRAALSRPTQHYGLEIEFMTSDPLLLHGYPQRSLAVLPTQRIVFPRYEIASEEAFDELLMTFDRDLWNAGGHHPTWELGLDWRLK